MLIVVDTIKAEDPIVRMRGQLLTVMNLAALCVPEMTTDLADRRHHHGTIEDAMTMLPMEEITTMDGTGDEVDPARLMGGETMEDIVIEA